MKSPGSLLARLTRTKLVASVRGAVPLNWTSRMEAQTFGHLHRNGYRQIITYDKRHESILRRAGRNVEFCACE